MQHRNTYQPPNTPSFSIEETTNSSSDTPPSSATFIPLGPTASLSSNNSSPNRSTHQNGAEQSYFTPNEKSISLNPSNSNPYPPPSSRSPTRTHFTAPNTNTSSVHLPLLHDQESSSSPSSSSTDDPSQVPIHSRRHFSNGGGIPIHHSRSNSNKGGGGSSWLRSLVVTRTRLHPLVLIPVFLLGVLCAATLGGGNGRESLGRSAMSSLKGRFLKSFGCSNNLELILCILCSYRT